MSLLQRVLRDFRLDPWGHHGIRHWARVRRNGRLIAQHTPGVDLLVLDLFAVLHDWQRHDEHEDPEHGWRGRAKLVSIEHWLPPMSKGQREQLNHAIEYHSDGRAEAKDVTVAACWNADRLDLGRVGISPDPDRMSPLALPDEQAFFLACSSGFAEFGKQKRMKKWTRFPSSTAPR